MSDPWKACDIRGFCPADVSPDLFRRLGRTVGSSMPAASRALVAGDFRASTPDLKAALACGLMESGAHVVDSGPDPHSRRLLRPPALEDFRCLNCDCISQSGRTQWPEVDARASAAHT